MKKLLLVVIIVLLATAAQAEDLELAWDANTESDLAGYVLYYGTASGNYSNSVDVGNITQHTITIPDNIVHYVAVKAYDTDGNYSDYSNEINTIAPLEPGGLRRVHVNVQVTITGE